MKRLVLLIFVCLGLLVNSSLAQIILTTPTPTVSPSPSATPSSLPAFEAPPCVVSLRDAASLQDVLVFSFLNVGDALRLPGLPPIACNLPAELALALDRSPSVGINQSPPLALPVDPTLVATARGYAIVNTTAANLRSGPGAQFSRVGQVRGGDNLLIIGHNANQSWWYVQTGDLRGWIFGDLVILRGDLSDLPIVETTSELIAPTLYVGFTGNPLYNELSDFAVSLCAVQGNIEHPLLGVSFNQAWYVIEATCIDGSKQVGWLTADAGLVRNPSGVILPVIREIAR